MAGVQSHATKATTAPALSVYKAIANRATARATQLRSLTGQDCLFNLGRNLSVGKIIGFTLQRYGDLSGHRRLPKQAADFGFANSVGNVKSHSTGSRQGQFAFKNGPCHVSSPSG